LKDTAMNTNLEIVLQKPVSVNKCNIINHLQEDKDGFIGSQSLLEKTALIELKDTAINTAMATTTTTTTTNTEKTADFTTSSSSSSDDVFNKDNDSIDDKVNTNFQLDSKQSDLHSFETNLLTAETEYLSFLQSTTTTTTTTTTTNVVSQKGINLAASTSDNTKDYSIISSNLPFALPYSPPSKKLDNNSSSQRLLQGSSNTSIRVAKQQTKSLKSHYLETLAVRISDNDDDTATGNDSYMDKSSTASSSSDWNTATTTNLLYDPPSETKTNKDNAHGYTGNNKNNNNNNDDHYNIDTLSGEITQLKFVASTSYLERLDNANAIDAANSNSNLQNVATSLLSSSSYLDALNAHRRPILPGDDDDDKLQQQQITTPSGFPGETLISTYHSTVAVAAAATRTTFHLGTENKMMPSGEENKAVTKKSLTEFLTGKKSSTTNLTSLRKKLKKKYPGTMNLLKM